MFEKLSPTQKENIYKVMQFRKVVKNETIIKEGDHGDEMYIVDRLLLLLLLFLYFFF
jgi:hypothetical protein